jgi:hypothetical protein
LAMRRRGGGRHRLDHTGQEKRGGGASMER